MGKSNFRIKAYYWRYIKNNSTLQTLNLIRVFFCKKSKSGFMKLNLNGELLENKVLFSADNRAFKYGDALFETLKVVNNQINFFEPGWVIHHGCNRRNT